MERTNGPGLAIQEIRFSTFKVFHRPEEDIVISRLKIRTTKGWIKSDPIVMIRFENGEISHYLYASRTTKMRAWIELNMAERNFEEN